MSAVSQPWAYRLVAKWCEARSVDREARKLVVRCRHAYRSGPLVDPVARFAAVLEAQTKRRENEWRKFAVIFAKAADEIEAGRAVTDDVFTRHGNQANDLEGQRFGRLLVIGKAPNRGDSLAWTCRCDCGRTVAVRTYSLRYGRTKSCGCLNAELRSQHARKHGLCGSPIYTTWQNMIARCYRPTAGKYAIYGGRGIFVCEALRKSVDSLYALLGERPVGKSLDRIDPDGSYTCGKCTACIENNWPLNLRWATPLEQVNNRRISKRI